MWLCYTSFYHTFLALCSFANDLLLAVYFIFILDYRNDAYRQKTNLSDFLKKFLLYFTLQYCIGFGIH